MSPIVVSSTNPVAPWSPGLVQFNAQAMTVAEIAINPFLTKESKITLGLDGGATAERELIINQTHKALLVNGQLNPNQINHTVASTGNIINVTSNAKWKVSLSPTSASAITGTNLGIAQGQELYDGSSLLTKQNYDIAISNTLYRYNYLTFSDAETPKRFDDVVLTITQCASEQDYSMVYLKNQWEEKYGIKPGVDEPNSDGDVTKNPNRVQWYYDQNGNIFFSAMFGTMRWMTTNLAATTYVAQGSKPALVYSYYATTVWSQIGYPYYDNNTNPQQNALYLKRPRLGVLYNWSAALGVPWDTAAGYGDQGNQPTNIRYQGICPNDWRMPSDWDWSNLTTYLQANPTKHSTNTVGTNLAVTMKEVCENTPYTGKSFSVLDGGFSVLLAGMNTAQGVAWGYSSSLGEVGAFWTSSNFSGLEAWARVINYNSASILRTSPMRSQMWSVRCIKP